MQTQKDKTPADISQIPQEILKATIDFAFVDICFLGHF